MLLALSLHYEALRAIQDPLLLISTTERLRRPTALPLTAIIRDADGRPADREHPQTVRFCAPPSAGRHHRCRAKRGAGVAVTLLDVSNFAAKRMRAHGPRAVHELRTMVSLDTRITASAPPQRSRPLPGDCFHRLGRRRTPQRRARDRTRRHRCLVVEPRFGGSGEASSFVDRAPEPPVESTLESHAAWMPAHSEDRSRREPFIDHWSWVIHDTRVSFMNGTGKQVKGNIVAPANNFVGVWRGEKRGAVKPPRAWALPVGACYATSSVSSRTPPAPSIVGVDDHRAADQPLPPLPQMFGP
ncbi:hypothetical protein AURDEDRAFT_177118 [Auricularia subglabra TFB-10046 SS5]|uniref:Uncharacterized protein n=1 Tax=Auricularia subglabra (strain TFB-10046 / SS5) TaxID=717982 RepID=J0WN67_AURST|nr:hypothetical protein AURDEDRAFT_177118 [Auricularia subglabra TFB-10046 SS5]